MNHGFARNRIGVILLGSAWVLSAGSCSPLQASAPDCTHTRQVLKCVKYVKNYDGDTLTVDVPGVHPFFGENAKVRVRGIDTPEIKGQKPCEKDAARVARRLTENLLKHASRIDLENLDRDKYFRILADVWVDGKSLGEILMKNGLAVPYLGKRKAQTNWCQALKVKLPE